MNGGDPLYCEPCMHHRWTKHAMLRKWVPVAILFIRMRIGCFYALHVDETCVNVSKVAYAVC